MYENVSKITRNISEYPAWEIEVGLENSEYPYRKWNSDSGKYDFSYSAQAGYEANPFYEKTEEDFYETLIDFSEIAIDSGMPLVEGKYAMLPDGSMLEGTYPPIEDGVEVGQDWPSYVYYREVPDSNGFYKKGSYIRYYNNLPASEIGSNFDPDPWTVVTRFALNNEPDMQEYGLYQKYNCDRVGHLNSTSTSDGELTATIIKGPEVDRLTYVTVTGMYNDSTTATLLQNDYTITLFKAQGDVPEYPDGRTICTFSAQPIDYNGVLVSSTSSAAPLTATLYWLTDINDDKILKFEIRRGEGTYSKRLTLVPNKSHVVCYSTWYKNPQYSRFFCFQTQNEAEEGIVGWDLCDYVENILTSGEAYNVGEDYPNVFSFDVEEFPLELKDVEPGDYLLRIPVIGEEESYHYIPVEIDTGYNETGEPIWAFKSYTLDKIPYLGQGVNADNYPTSIDSVE